MKKIIIAVILLFIAFSASAQLHADLRVGATASSFGDRHLKICLLYTSDAADE